MAVLKDLIVHGSSRFVNGIKARTINVESIGADIGIFNKLVATSLDAETATIDDLTAKNATVTALLDVQGDMHTNSWSNSNMATIDGNFYITPTSVSADGSDVSSSSYTPTGTIAYTSPNFTKISITGTFDTSQLILNNNSHIAWPANSEVIVTGDVLVGNEWFPLGTIRGKLESQIAANNASKTFSIIPLSSTLTDGQGNIPITLEEIRKGLDLSSGTSSTFKMRKVKISITSRASGSTQYPVGMLLTAQGTGTGQTFIDIYGGGNARNGQTGTINGDSKTFTLPTTRIGNLEGLPKLTLPNGAVTPQGWGIYTSNGFFSGTIVSKQGQIGNFTINSLAIYSDSHSTYNADSAGIYIGKESSSSNNYFVAGGNKASWYLKSDGSAKIGTMTLNTSGVLKLGEISLNASGTATIGPWTVDSSSIYKSNKNYGNANGMYFGDRGISLGSTFQVTNAGELTATSGTIGGFTIADTDLYNENITGTGDDKVIKSVYMSLGTNTPDYPIGGHELADEELWAFTAGQNFGVTTSGTLYASDLSYSIVNNDTITVHSVKDAITEITTILQETSIQANKNSASIEDLDIKIDATKEITDFLTPVKDNNALSFISFAGATYCQKQLAAADLALQLTLENEYNLLFTPSGILLRQNSNILGLFDSSGLHVENISIGGFTWSAPTTGKLILKYNN